MRSVSKVETKTDLEIARGFFETYAASLDFDLDFQDFEEELSSLPGQYAPPEGRLLIAAYGDDPAGCIALRKLENRICEMKRLYVKPQFRGAGIGRALAEAIIEEAKEIGYHRMRLDTVPPMESARSLYTSLGFKKIGAYRYNPIQGAEFMELALA
jgi:ribosomal protein S18 acetylase RimI-like enzyme